MKPTINSFARAFSIALVALLGACSALPRHVEADVVVPAGGRAVTRIDLTQVAPIELQLDVDSAGEVKLSIDAASASHSSSTEITATFPPHYFRQRFDRDDGELTIAIESSQQARVRCRIAGKSEVEVTWLVTAREGAR